MTFVNFVGEDISVATYINPGYAHSDDMTLLVTMSKFASGVNANDFGDNAPWSWMTDKDAVIAEGEWWSAFRQISIDFASLHS